MPCCTRRGLLVKVDFHCYATMEIHLKWNRSNLWKAARKIKSWARFNFYVYAWPSTHCLFFIYAPTRNIKVTRQWKYILTRWDWTELLNKMPGLSKNIKCLLKTGSWLSKTALARALTQFDPFDLAGWTKVFIWRKMAQLGGWPTIERTDPAF